MVSLVVTAIMTLLFLEGRVIPQTALTLVLLTQENDYFLFVRFGLFFVAVRREHGPVCARQAL